MTTSRTGERALQILTGLSILLLVMVFQSLAVALFLAAVLASVLAPSHTRLTRLFRGRSGAASVLLIVLGILLVTGPLVGLASVVVVQAAATVDLVTTTLHSARVEELIQKLPGSIAHFATEIIAKIPKDGVLLEQIPLSQLSASTGRAAAALGAAVGATGTILVQGTMMAIALFFFLTERDKILAWIEDLSPLRPGHASELLSEIRLVAGAVLKSTALTALAQAVVAFVGYLIAGVPQPAFVAAVTFFVALIPAVGAAAVCLLAAAFLLLGGHTGAAIFLALWGVIVVGLVDNIVKPWLIRGAEGVEMHGGVVFFSLIGGLSAFGMLGLLIGPLAVALFVTCMRMYRRDFGIVGGGGFNAHATELSTSSSSTPS